MAVVDRTPMEKQFSKSLYKHSLGKITVREAEMMAPTYVDRFLKGCETSQELAHKGIDWYAKEIAKSLLTRR